MQESEPERKVRDRERERERDGCIVQLKFSSAELCELRTMWSRRSYFPPPLSQSLLAALLLLCLISLPAPLPPVPCLACLIYSMAFYLLIKSL